jgi:hypothetical protein
LDELALLLAVGVGERSLGDNITISTSSSDSTAGVCWESSPVQRERSWTPGLSWESYRCHTMLTASPNLSLSVSR